MNAQDSNEKTTLTLASDWGHADVVRVLSSGGDYSKAKHYR